MEDDSYMYDGKYLVRLVCNCIFIMINRNRIDLGNECVFWTFVISFYI